MDLSQIIHDLQPYLHRATWILPAIAAYIAARSAWGARKASPFVRRTMSGLALSILLTIPLYSNQTMGVWVSVLVIGLALSAVGITRQALYKSNSWLGHLMKFSMRGLAGVGGVAAMASLIGIASGNALVLSLGPSMWPTAAISPTVEWLNTKAYRLGPPMAGDDIEFTVDWKNGQAFRNNELGWPSGRYRKRVWAIPGDVIRISSKQVTVNHQVVLDCSDMTQRTWTSGEKTWQASAGSWWCFPDFDGDGVADNSLPLVWGRINQYMYSGLTYHVQPGELFVMGDNTIQSSDSRELGPIKISWVDGRHSRAHQPKGKTVNTYY